MINSDLKLELYYKMKLIADVEEKLACLYNSQNNPLHTSIHLYRGQEAIAVGFCSLLDKNDIVFSNHRSHGHYIAKGGDLNGMFAELYGKDTGCCRGKGGSMHLCDMNAGVAPSSGIVAGNVSIATGYALANKIKGNKSIVVVFLGDGATEEGSVYESICLSKIKNIPIIYVCENNRYAIYSDFEAREPLDNISDKFSNIVNVVRINGNDVENVYCTAKKVINSMREGDGPYFIECDTYRLKNHYGTSDGIMGRRTQEELNHFLMNDPVIKVEQDLIDDGYAEDVHRINEHIKKEIQSAITFAENSLYPSKDMLMVDV